MKDNINRGESLWYGGSGDVGTMDTCESDGFQCVITNMFLCFSLKNGNKTLKTAQGSIYLIFLYM